MSSGFRAARGVGFGVQGFLGSLGFASFGVRGLYTGLVCRRALLRL